MRWVLSLVISFIMLLPGAFAPAQAMTNDEFERRVQYHIGQVRDNHNLPDVTKGRCVDRRSERYAEKLSDNGVLVHSNLMVTLDRCGGVGAGEVLAVGFSRPGKVVRAWMNSPAHRTVLMNGRYDKIGVGVKNSPRGKVVVVQFIAK
jgi:uncharacterized protein YkwD